MKNLRIGTEVETIEGGSGRIIKVEGNFYHVELFETGSPDDDSIIILPWDAVEAI